jgi:glycosyltransferase involved in cell wall biosynthesis
MAMEMPCITSDLANQALGAEQDHEILIGSTAGEYAGHILKLLSDQSFADTMAQNGHAFVKKVFSWENSVAELEKLFKKQ